MADLHKVGSRTPQAVIYKSESHKLHQAFPVKKGDIIVQGQPVKLNNDGTISPYTGAEGEMYIGIAGVEVTVMVQGYTVIHGIAKQEVATTGYVQTDGTLDDSGIYPNYSPSASNAETPFLAINTAEVGELVRILVK